MSLSVNSLPRVRGHFERLSENVRHYFKDLNGTYEVTASEQVIENGRVVKKAVSKIVVPNEQNVGVCVSDFYLENIIAVGAVDSLRECQLNEGVLVGADNVDAQIGAIDGAIVADVEHNLTSEGE